MDGATLFSFNGRTGPKKFINAALLLIAIGFILNCLPVISPALGLLGIIGLILIWPWLAIWVKRLHDAGKSGWLVIAVLVVWLIVSYVVSSIVTGMFVDTAAIQAEAEAAAASGDLGGVFASTFQQAQAAAIPSAIASAIVSLIVVFGGNAVLKQDPTENQYGPPPAA